MPSGQIRFFVLIFSFSFASFFTQIGKRRSIFSGGVSHLKIDLLLLICVKNDAKEKKEKEKEKKEKIGFCLSKLPFFDDRKNC